MRAFNKYTSIVGIFLLSLIFFSSCKEFLNPDQEINITKDKLYEDWYEYRSMAMGLYGLQTQLAEQLVILGELRGDLMKITDNADEDMVEVYNFDISKENKYAQPTNFFKLITATNSFITELKLRRPEVLDPESPINNYDKLYGEALCMRAWAYFNAARIYGKVPFLPESITSVDEVNKFLETSGTYIDTVKIVYGTNGYDNDTLTNVKIELEKQYYNLDLVIDHFTNELENEVKSVGVNHFIENKDQTWEVTIWNNYAYNALLGVMYLTEGDLAQAARCFEFITKTNSENYRYQIDNSFAFNRWKNIFTNIDPKEHILAFDFNKGDYQQNRFQEMFEPREPHKYMLKPTRSAIMKWETTFIGYQLDINNSQPWLTKTVVKGFPGDYYRGFDASYTYMRNGERIPEVDWFRMTLFRSEEDYRTSALFTEGADTVIYKYSIDQNVYDQDADFIVYRAGGVHLWLAEVYVWWKFEQNGVPREFTSNAVNIINDGAQYDINSNREQMGVRGRVGIGGSTDGIRPGNINYIHHPFTNDVTGYIDVSGDFHGLQIYLEDQLIEERARELAFEGERFYDLMRVAKRRNDPSFLAKQVSEKFPENRREEIYNLLLDENNWFINYFD